MSSRQNRYSRHYKTEAVAKTREPGATRAQVARDLGLSEGTLARWARDFDPREKVEPETEQEELSRLRRELARVTEERDFLKKAAAFFAKEKL